MQLRVAHVVERTEAEGPGFRFAIWTQGCTLRCASCCNPELFPAEGGQGVEIDTLVQRIVGTSDIEGVSLLGGEPLQQAEPVARLCERVREAGLSVMIYSGYTRSEIEALGGDAAAAIRACDLLVDGRYECDRPEANRRWIGSNNQVMHFMSARYSPSDPRFVASNTIEIRLRGRELSVNGWPGGSNVLDRRRT